MIDKSKIVPGVNIKFVYDEKSFNGIVLITVKDDDEWHSNECVVYSPDDGFDECGLALGRHVDRSSFGTGRFMCVDNITEYHLKLHLWIRLDSIVEIINTVSVAAKKGIIYSCSICKIPNDMAEPNQPDNTFKCYSCRTNPLRVYY